MYVCMYVCMHVCVYVCMCTSVPDQCPYARKYVCMPKLETFTRCLLSLVRTGTKDCHRLMGQGLDAETLKTAACPFIFEVGLARLTGH